MLIRVLLRLRLGLPLLAVMMGGLCAERIRGAHHELLLLHLLPRLRKLRNFEATERIGGQANIRCSLLSSRRWNIRAIRRARHGMDTAPRIWTQDDLWLQILILRRCILVLLVKS